MPNSINYLGGGLKNSGTPTEYYKIIDERKSETRKVESSDKPGEIFAKALNKQKVNDITARGKTKPLPTKVTKPFEGKSALGAKSSDIIPNKNKTPIITSTQVNNKLDPDGTDLARMNKVAKELTTQVKGFLWTRIAEGVNQNPEGGFGEAIFQKSLWPELVKNSTGKDLDEVEQSIVRDLMKQQENNVKQTNVKQRK